MELEGNSSFSTIALDCRLDAVLEEVSRLVCNLWSLMELTASDEDEEDIPYAYCFQFDLMMEWIELSVHSKWFYLPWLLVALQSCDQDGTAIDSTS
jgi:hypothetical protein